MDIISKLKKGDRCSESLLLVGVSAGMTARGIPKRYFTLIFSDGTQNVEAKQWSVPMDALLPATEKVYDIVADLSEYNGKIQMTITTMSPNVTMLPEDFVYQVAETEESLRARFQALFMQIKSAILRDILLAVMNDYDTEYFTVTSATAMHHVGVRGNALHSIEVAEIALGAANAMHTFMPHTSLIIVGGLLHDLGKIKTYNTNLQLDYTLEGVELDHTVLGAAMLEKYILQDNSNLSVIRLLQHIIASHHGVLEYGAAVLPKCLEAVLINKADGISASANELMTANTLAPADQVLTAKIYPMGNVTTIKRSYIGSVCKEED